MSAPCADRVVHGAHVLAQIVDAQRIFEHGAFDARRIEERRAVLGDVDGRIAVAVLDPQQRVGQPLRKDFPAGLGVRVMLLPHRRRPQRPRMSDRRARRCACSS